LYQIYKILSGESTYSDVTVMTKVLQLGQKAKSRRHSPSDPKMTFYPLTSKWVKQKGCEKCVPVTGVEQVSPFCLVRLQRGGGGMVCSFSVTKHSVSVWTVDRPVPAVWSKEPWNKLQAVRPRLCDLYRRPCSQHKWKNKYLLSLQAKRLCNTTVPCNNELNSVIFIRFRNILLGLLRALTLCYIKLVQVRFNKSFSTSKKTQSASVTELKWFTVLRNNRNLLWKNTKQINTLCGQNTELLIFKAGGAYSCHCDLTF
jgi:hypothetical protein